MIDFFLWTVYYKYSFDDVCLGIRSESILQAFDDRHQTCWREPSSIKRTVGFSPALLFTVFGTIFDFVPSEVSSIDVKHFSQTHVAACQYFLSELPIRWLVLIEVLILNLESTVSFALGHFLLIQIAVRILYIFVGDLTFYRNESSHVAWKFVVAFSFTGCLRFGEKRVSKKLESEEDKSEERQ